MSTSHRTIVGTLRRRLPRETFGRTPGRLLAIVPHALVVTGGVAVAPPCPPLALPIVMLLCGHSLACLAFIAHELSHGSILPPGRLRAALEVFLWGMIAIPATMWRRIHNELHHVHAGTPADPDRQYIAGEQTWLTRWYRRIFYTGTDSLFPWNPMVLVSFPAYVFRNLIAVFRGPERRPAFVPAVPRYRRRDRLRVIGELATIVAIQALLALATGSLFAFLAVGPGAILIASAVIMLYVFTNHFLDPVEEENDVLGHTTSVVVPRWMDRLHGHFSKHTEHHLFPALGARYLPMVQESLREEFGEEYQCLPLADAWRRLWAVEPFPQVSDLREDCVKKPKRTPTSRSGRRPLKTSCSTVELRGADPHDIVRPDKASMFGRSQSCRERNQTPVAWMAVARETETAEAHRQSRSRNGERAAGPQRK